MTAVIKHLDNEPTKVRILDSALQLFASRGFDGATTREIADSAGVNHALIKYHFGNKDALWKAAVNLLFDRLDEAYQKGEKEAETISDPAERLRVKLRHYIRYCAEHPEHARIMVQESTSENDRLAWAVKQHIAKSRVPLEERFEELFDNGILPRMSKISLRYIIAAACQSIFTLAAEIKHLYGVSSDHEAQIEAHIDAVLKLMVPE